MKREPISKYTNEHLINSIRFFERKLKSMPGEQYYMGDSEYAEQAVEYENTHNEIVARELTSHIAYMKRIAHKRGLKIN